MKRNATVLMIAALALVVTACNNNKYTKVVDSPYALLNGRTAKKVYESLQGSGIGSLNYLTTSNADNARHFANFVDGLLTHSEFGTIELNLAESAKHNADYTEFEFKVRSDEALVWSTFEGKPYSYNGEVQYVKAEDFVAGAKRVCSYPKSDTLYLMQDFLAGACEYYWLSVVRAGQNDGTPEYAALTTDALVATWIQKKIKAENENVYYNGGYDETPLKGSDIKNIENGSRFGVTCDSAANTVTYHLMKPASYFPTLLTYSCYLPVNSHFIAEKGSGFGKSSPDGILYNGPFILSELNETTIVYKKNKTYHKRKDLHGYNTARVETVKYNIPKGNIGDDYSRTQFEAGKIDGFSLSQNDKVGWQKYVVGKEGTGTYDNPADGLVNSRFIDTIGFIYGTNLVLERSKNAASYTSYSSFSGAKDADKKASIKNTERALRLGPVRRALMASLDHPTYYSRYAGGDSSSIFAYQGLVHTYVPKNFVRDNNGNEYTETYYAGELAAKKGISIEEARALIEPGQWDTIQLTKDEARAAALEAEAAIDFYNADSALVSKYGKIEKPVNIEYLSAWYNQTNYAYDSLMINEMNKRLNGIDEVDEDYGNCSLFRIIPTDLVDESNYETASGEASHACAADFSVHSWGWGADYGDPLTYLNTYTIKGDWSSVFYYLNLDEVPNLDYSSDHSGLVESNLLRHYTDLVREGQLEYENLAERYRIFAEAEVHLIEDLAIYLPGTNGDQGWALSVSKAAGYECPKSNYGLSNDRITGMWVLKNPLKGTERAQLRAEQQAYEDAYLATHDYYNIYG